MIEREVREGRGQLWRPSRRPLKEEWRERVVELVGEPGDVVFFHPWLLHAAAPNRRSVPRFMFTQSATTTGPRL